jgi:peroxiredoxin
MSNAARRRIMIVPNPSKESMLVTRRIGGLLAGATLALLLQAAATVNAAIGDMAPDFTLPAASGGNERLSEHRGEVVLLTFWSSRCAVCVQQLAALGELEATYRSAGLVTLAISVDDDMKSATQFAKSHPARFPLLLDRQKEVGRAYNIEQLPTTVLIDRRGRVRFLQGDYHGTDNSYVAQVRALLDDPL